MRVPHLPVLSLLVLMSQMLVAKDSAEETEAIHQIEALGGMVRRAGNETGGEVEIVSLVGSQQLKDDDLQLLKSFPNLKRLYIGNTQIGDAGLKHISGLKQLTNVGLIGTKVTDEGMKHLAKLENLQEMRMAATSITDAGLKNLGGLKNLQELLLGNTSVTDEGMNELVKFENLTYLQLDSTAITDAGLNEISKLKNLTTLFVDETNFSARALKELRESLPNLQINPGGRQGVGNGRRARTIVVAVGFAGLLAGGIEGGLTSGFVGSVVGGLAGGFSGGFAADQAVEQVGGGQRSDPNFDVSIEQPAYIDKHPEVLFDEAHQNFHTASGRYKVFAKLITNDGYRVSPGKQPFTPELLARYSILVIANAMANSGPPNSAFTDAECDCVEKWVKEGGSLLLVTDHEPFGSASSALAQKFGVDMSSRTAFDSANEGEFGLQFSREKKQLGDHPIMTGRNDSEKVDRVLTFTGQSLKGPPGSVALLKFADTAVEVGETNQQTSAAGRSQGVALKHGTGRVVVMGEAAQLSAQVYGNPPQPMGMNVPGCDNRKMVLNLMHWLSGLTGSK